MNRRKFLTVSTAASSAALTGCSEAGFGGPDPTVVDTEVDRSLSELLGGEADFLVTVSNEGSAGNVRVTLRIVDAQGTTLDRESTTVRIEEGERRQVTISMQVPSEADRWEARAEAA